VNTCSAQLPSGVPPEVEQVGGAPAVGRAEAGRYDIAAWESLDLPAELALRKATFTLPLHFDDLRPSKEVVYVPPQPLLLPQMPRYPGFEAAPGAPRVDVVASRERETTETTDGYRSSPWHPDHKLVEARVGGPMFVPLN
jgi:hypothetical protein